MRREERQETRKVLRRWGRRPKRTELAHEIEEQLPCAQGLRHAAACGRSLAPRLEQSLERVRVAEIPGFGQCPVECRDILDDRRSPARLRQGSARQKSKCGDRSNAIAGSRAKLALTDDSTRSSAAAYGSAASGRASNI